MPVYFIRSSANSTGKISCKRRAFPHSARGKKFELMIGRYIEVFLTEQDAKVQGHVFVPVLCWKVVLSTLEFLGMDSADRHISNKGDNREERYDIFISHSTWRHPFPHQLVNDLANLLTASGLKVFLDRFELKGGETLFGCIKYAIKHSDVGILVITRAAMASGWVQLELELMLKQQYSKKMCLVALFLENCSKPKGVEFYSEVTLLNPHDLFPGREKIKEVIHSCQGRSGWNN